MKEIYKQYKPFFLFLTRFICSYIVLLLLYKIFLNGFDVKNNEIDSVTYLVAEQSNWVLNKLGYKSYIVRSNIEPCVNLFFGTAGYYVRIIEGCNAVSVMILFISFCIAFSAYFVRTFLYIIFGLIIIYVLNIVRICSILILTIKFPNIEELLHDVFFPLFIYGVVFVLWCLWLFKFSGYAEKYAIKK
jgi:exosortase family protein XrtF